MVISVSSDTVDPANNGKLIHTQGLANTEEVLRDDVFGVSETATKLVRNVSMYQWKEDVTIETKEKVGGTKETKNTYNYSKDWNSSETNSSDPQIGDMKISFQIVKPTDVSLIYQQQGNSFSPYKTSGGKETALFKTGIADATAMFAQAQASNTMITWALRIGGMLIMWVGLGMVFKPLSVLGSVLPFLGNLIGMGTSILAFLITLPCSMLTIAMAWIAYRPLLAGALITVAVLAIVAMKFMPRKSMAPAQA